MVERKYCDICGLEIEEKSSQMDVDLRLRIPEFVPAIYPPPKFNHHWDLCDGHANEVKKLIEKMKEEWKC